MEKKPKVFIPLKKNVEGIGHGQATVIYQGLLANKNGGMTQAQLVAAVKGKVKLNPKFKATIEACVHSHLNTFLKKGWVQVKGPKK